MWIWLTTRLILLFQGDNVFKKTYCPPSTKNVGFKDLFCARSAQRSYKRVSYKQFHPKWWLKFQTAAYWVLYTMRMCVLAARWKSNSQQWNTSISFTQRSQGSLSISLNKAWYQLQQTVVDSWGNWVTLKLGRRIDIPRIKHSMNHADLWCDCSDFCTISTSGTLQKCDIAWKLNVSTSECIVRHVLCVSDHHCFLQQNMCAIIIKICFLPRMIAIALSF